MNKDEIINKLLDKISHKPNGFIFIYKSYINKDPIELESYRKIMINDLELIRYARLTGDDVILTDFGDKVKSEGGWIEYNDKIRKDKNVNEKEESKKFWIPVILTIFGLILLGIQIYQASKQAGQQLEIEKIKTRLDSAYNKIYDLENLLKNADKQILKRNTISDSLYNNLKVGQKIK